jgi:hypothetical protein
MDNTMAVIGWTNKSEKVTLNKHYVQEGEEK